MNFSSSPCLVAASHRTIQFLLLSGHPGRSVDDLILKAITYIPGKIKAENGDAFSHLVVLRMANLMLPIRFSDHNTPNSMYFGLYKTNLTDLTLSRHFFEFPKLPPLPPLSFEIEFRETIFFLVNSTVGSSTSFAIFLELLQVRKERKEG
jgi:hypothetical protein